MSKAQGVDDIHANNELKLDLMDRVAWADHICRPTRNNWTSKARRGRWFRFQRAMAREMGGRGWPQLPLREKFLHLRAA